MLLELTEITGFESNDSTVEIFDGVFRPFYFLENPDQKRVTFNLPEGVYYLACKVKQLSRPLRYECPNLPRKEKFIDTVDELNIEVSFNPNKASYENQTGNMLIDHETIWSTTIPKRRFVMGHELGHTYYYTEWKCDLFSAYSMLEQGYNPSQCFYANYFCLSDKQQERKDKLFNALKKVKCHE